TFIFVILQAPPSSTLFPYTTLFRSKLARVGLGQGLPFRVPFPHGPVGPVAVDVAGVLGEDGEDQLVDGIEAPGRIQRPEPALEPDRKSTRLNSSHVASLYAVFCLKK